MTAAPGKRTGWSGERTGRTGEKTRREEKDAGMGGDVEKLDRMANS